MSIPRCSTPFFLCASQLETRGPLVGWPTRTINHRPSFELTCTWSSLPLILNIALIWTFYYNICVLSSPYNSIIVFLLHFSSFLHLSQGTVGRTTRWSSVQDGFRILSGSSGGSSPVVRHYRDFLTPKSICFASSCIFFKKEEEVQEEEVWCLKKRISSF